MMIRRFAGPARARLLVLFALLVMASGWLQGCAQPAAAPAPEQAGPSAPAFTLPSATGGEVSLSDYTGEQPVLLYFHMAVG